MKIKKAKHTLRRNPRNGVKNLTDKDSFTSCPEKPCEACSTGFYKKVNNRRGRQYVKKAIRSFPDLA